MSKPARPTPEQVAAFDQHMQEWQTTLGLQSWRIERGAGYSDAMADVSFDLPAKLAVYRAGYVGSESRQTALHECLHILLRDLIDAAASRDDSRITQTEHGVINTLERLLIKL